MKKLLSITLLMLILGGVSAQVVDTMKYRDGRCPRYYYTFWYDTTSCYRSSPISLYIDTYTPMWHVGNRPFSFAKQEYAPDNMLITGIAVMVKDTSMLRIVEGVTDPTPVPDTCYVFTYDSSTTQTTILGAVRWDTASPKVWLLPMNADSSLSNCYQECKVYEAMFPTPVAIDSDSYFWVMATVNCNVAALGPSPFIALHPPKYFARIYRNNSSCLGAPGFAVPFYTETDPNDGESMHIYRFLPEITSGFDYMCGYYLPISDVQPDTVVLTTASADVSMGYTSPTMRRVPRGFLQTIEAHCNDGYVFTHWNDGSTENPRRVRIWDTAHYVAYFVQRKYNVVTEVVGRGYVEGGGTHLSGDTVELRAIPRGFHVFRHWQDGDTTNPRRFVVTCDTTFCAHFTQGPYTIIADAPDGGGTVEGGGVYEFMDTVILTAYPFENYSFSHWQYGDTTNPYTFIVYWPGAYHAYFTCDTCGSDTASHDTTAIVPVAQAAALFTLAPNPATGKVTVEVKSDELKDKSGVATLTLRDAAGHEVRRFPLPAGDTALTLDLSDLPAGAYFVTLATPTASSTQRLVVK